MRKLMILGDTVRKVRGYKWPGVIVADFTTLSGERRLVVECTAEVVRGALHICAPEQLEKADAADTTLAEDHGSYPLGLGGQTT